MVRLSRKRQTRQELSDVRRRWRGTGGEMLRDVDWEGWQRCYIALQTEDNGGSTVEDKTRKHRR